MAEIHFPVSVCAQPPVCQPLGLRLPMGLPAASLPPACCPDGQMLTESLKSGLGPIVPLLQALTPIVGFIQLFLKLPGVVTSPTGLADFISDMNKFVTTQLPALLNMVPLPANPLPWIAFVRDTLNVTSSIFRCVAMQAKQQVAISLDIMEMRNSGDQALYVVADCADSQQQVLLANLQLQTMSINQMLATVTVAFELALAAAPPVKKAMQDAGIYPLTLSPEALTDPDALLALCDTIDAFVADYLTPLVGEP